MSTTYWISGAAPGSETAAMGKMIPLTKEEADETVELCGGTAYVESSDYNRLRAELTDLRDACAEKQRCIDSSVAAQRAFLAEIDALRAELAEVRRDAERYRWLRRPRIGWDVLHQKDEDSRWMDLCGQNLDAEIDAAMAGGEHG